ncbi:hypothetical protein BG004_004690 [Podila humilis]|nr:hypothetical protein BG004_004690 [Podila humilis]
MEIVKGNFETSLPMLKKAIEECDFVAMDTEMTGLGLPINIPKATDSLASRYRKVSTSATDFLVVQLGICTFTWNDDIAGYEARPFNFPCFPSSTDEAKTGERFFSCQSSSLEFLIENGFDFNKWIKDGIPYMTRPEEDAYIIRKTEKEAHNATASFNNIIIDDRNKPFVTNTTNIIQEWLQNSTEEKIVVQAANSFLRRLVHQIIRTDFNDGLHAVSDARARIMTIQRMTDEIRAKKELAKVPKPPMLNLRRVLDMIVEAKKPLIGHNCFLDLMQISQQFLWNLPPYLDEWKQSLHLEWNTIIDTKHLATHPAVQQHLSNSGLDIVSECVQKEPFSAVGPKIVMAKGYNRYLADASLESVETESTKDEKKDQKEGIKYHEAGYDAYITGQAFLRFAGFILKEHERAAANQEEHTRKRRRVEDPEQAVDSAEATKNSGAVDTKKGGDDEEEEEEEGALSETELEKEMLMERSKHVLIGNPTKSFLETEELLNYYNYLHMMRSDIPVMNLTGPDQEPAERPWNFLLRNIPAGFTTSTLFFLFGPYNPFRFSWVDGTSAWIQLSRFPPGSGSSSTAVSTSTSASTTEGDTVSAAAATSGDDTLKTNTTTTTATEAPAQYEPKTIPIGPLGENYVKPFCVGMDDEAMKGREMGIDLDAAKIEVVSWKTWYDEKQVEENKIREQFRQNGVSSTATAYRGPNSTRPHYQGSRGDANRSMELVLPEQNDAVPGTKETGTATAASGGSSVPATVVTGALVSGSETPETSVRDTSSAANMAGMKRKMDEE